MSYQPYIVSLYCNETGESRHFGSRPLSGDETGIEISDLTAEPFAISELVGFEFPEVELFTASRGLGDGVFFTGQRLNGRTVEIHLRQLMRSPKDYYEAWKNLRDFFVPQNSYDVRVYNYGAPESGGVAVKRALRSCKFLALSYPFVNAGEPNPELIIQMTAESPYFEDFSEEAHAITYPDDTEFTYTYDGAVDTRFLMTLTLTAGGGAYTLDIWVNGARVEISKATAFVVGDVFVVDPENARFSVNGEWFPAFGTAPIYSSVNAFYENWVLRPGANTIRIGAFSPDKYDVTIDYSTKYMGAL